MFLQNKLEGLKSIKFKIVGIPIILLLIAILVVSIIALQFMRSSSLEQKREEGYNLSNQIIGQIEDNNNSLETVNELLEENIKNTGDLLLSNQDNLSNQYLQEVADDLDVHEINWISSEGEVVYSTHGYDGISLPEDHAALDFISSDGTYFMEDIRQDVQSDSYLKYGYVKSENDDLVQVGISADVITDLNERFSYQNLVERVASNEDVVYALFISNDLEAVAHSNTDRIGIELTDEGSITAAVEGEFYADEYYYDAAGVDVYDVLLPVVIDGEHIGAINLGFSMAEIYSTVTQTRVTIGIIALLLFIILATILYKISNSISKPLELTVTQCEKMARGDFRDELAKEWTEREDEIGKLARGFNKISSSMKGILKNIIDNIEGLSAYSEELSASSEEGNATIETTNDLINDVSAGIQQISASAEEVTGFSEEAYSQADIGSQNIENAVSSIKKINKEVKETVDVIEDLDATSQEIEQIISLINNIAEQTNLLALNASIEAARAGEHGQGFAVVAEEIRQLAGETAEATEKIADLVIKTQKQSGKGIKKVKEVEEKAKEGQEIIEETGKVFNEINSLVRETSSQIEQTANATNELAQSSDEITNATNDISNMSNEISNSSQELAEMAQNLQRLVEQFKI
ncbi:methyl-accepting chemotaxis protein [Natroniella sp. ANB-PHB2]|uniref:methyl-accepting chemotaxis protein n=1 Tax=Natroniella sp. ANB-PHB2 TaxID=3384444 RepID=UPI0038D3E4B5